VDEFTTRQFFPPPKRSRYSLNMRLVGHRFVYIIYIVAKFCVPHGKTARRNVLAQNYSSLARFYKQRRNLKISYKTYCMDNSYPFTEA
jgi:hypothetical protein